MRHVSGCLGRLGEIRENSVRALGRPPAPFIFGYLLLFQLAYTELYFTETLWPDFRERDLLTALTAYQTRARRFGMIDQASSISLSAANQA